MSSKYLLLFFFCQKHFFVRTMSLPITYLGKFNLIKTVGRKVHWVTRVYRVFGHTRLYLRKGACLSFVIWSGTLFIHLSIQKNFSMNTNRTVEWYLIFSKIDCERSLPFEFRVYLIQRCLFFWKLEFAYWNLINFEWFLRKYSNMNLLLKL